MKFFVLLACSCLLGAGLLAAERSPDAWYVEGQTYGGLSNTWTLWNGPYGYGTGFHLSSSLRDLDLTSLGLEAGREWGGHWRSGLWLDEDGWPYNGDWFSFHKVAITGGAFVRFWRVMRLGVDLGLGGFYRDTHGGYLQNALGGLLVGDLRLQADITHGFYVVTVMDWQDYMVSYDKDPDWILLTGMLRFGIGTRF